MSDQPSASGDSVDLQNPTASQNAASAKADASSQAEASNETPQRPTTPRKSWFGRDKRQSVAFYGDYYR